MSDLVRHGMQAATALYHMREHLPAPGITRTQLEATCPDYALLGDIANASKHHKIDRNNPRVSNADQIFEIGISSGAAESVAASLSSNASFPPQPSVASAMTIQRACILHTV